MKIILLLIIVLFIPITVALEECKPITQLSELPCQITSIWNYTPPCNSHTVSIYNMTGTNVINYTYQDFTESKCFFIFNLTEKGSYKHYTDNGDTGNIIVEAKDDMAAFSIVLFLMVLNIGIFISPLFFRLKSEISDYSIKRGITILGMMFLGFNMFILYVISSEYTTILADEMLFLFYIIETGLVFVIMTMMIFTLINRVKMIREEKKKQNMGENYE